MYTQDIAQHQSGSIQLSSLQTGIAACKCDQGSPRVSMPWRVPRHDRACALRASVRVSPPRVLPSDEHSRSHICNTRTTGLEKATNPAFSLTDTTQTLCTHQATGTVCLSSKQACRWYTASTACCCVGTRPRQAICPRSLDFRVPGTGR